MSYTNITRKRTYQCWQDMWQRCTNPHCHNYPNYGARGISVCKAWKLFHNFIEDMGIKPDGLTLERINNNGNYEPSNCKWATRAEQRRNQRDCIYVVVNGMKMTLEESAKHVGVHPTTLRSRIKLRSMTPQQAVEAPFGQQKRSRR